MSGIFYMNWKQYLLKFIEVLGGFLLWRRKFRVDKMMETMDRCMSIEESGRFSMELTWCIQSNAIWWVETVTGFFLARCISGEWMKWTRRMRRTFWIWMDTTFIHIKCSFERILSIFVFLFCLLFLFFVYFFFFNWMMELVEVLGGYCLWRTKLRVSRMMEIVVRDGCEPANEFYCINLGCSESHTIWEMETVTFILIKYYMNS